MYYVLETLNNGRLAFRGRPIRTKYEGERYAKTFESRGKTVNLHSFKNLTFAGAFVAEHNAVVDADRKPPHQGPCVSNLLSIERL